MERVYFDNAATTPLDPLVIKEMQRVMENISGNPSSIHQEGRQAKTLVEKSRKTVARLLNVAPGEIFFTGSGTEADNMAIRCSINDLSVTHIITSRIEHHAVLHSVDLCEKQGIKVSYVDLLENGHVNLLHLQALLTEPNPGKTLVSLMHANNEIGNLLDIESVGKICSETGAYFHCDTVQTIGHLPIDIKKSGIHFLSASAHKFNGPKGIGFIFIDEGVKLSPLIHGGAQERNMRGGTENTIGIAGLAMALEISYAEMDKEREHILGLKNYMIRRLRENFTDFKFNGDYEAQSLYTVLNVAFPSAIVSDMLLFNLDIEGISASGGSACSSGSDQGSHVLQALHLNNSYTSVRFSFGKYNTPEEVDFVIGKLKILIQPPVVMQQVPEL
jgi:cysteine desulfurase